LLCLSVIKGLLRTLSIIIKRYFSVCFFLSVSSSTVVLFECGKLIEMPEAIEESCVCVCISVVIIMFLFACSGGVMSAKVMHARRYGHD